MMLSVEAAGGTTGTPGKSDAAKGKFYHEHLVANLIKVIRRLREAK
jgi:creatinine amidohydrolase